MISNDVRIFEVYPSEQFNDDLEYLLKKKHYKKLPSQINEFVLELERGNLLGDVVQRMGLSNEEVVYKVRLANEDTKAGKSNGYRVIYYVQNIDKIIALLTIYYKKDMPTISDKEIKKILIAFCEEN